MIEVIIFDFDGLILDTEISAYQSWQKIYQEYQRELPLEHWLSCIGGTVEHFDPCAHLEGLLGAPIPREEVISRRRALHLQELEAQLTLPGVEGYLHDAQRLGLKIGLASNSSREWVEGHLARLDLLRYFDCLKTGDQVARAKPAPDLYRAVLDCLGVQARQAIALEDSPHGVRAAQAAGLFCIAVPNQMTARLSLDHADLRLSSLAVMPLEALLRMVEEKCRASLYTSRS